MASLSVLMKMITNLWFPPFHLDLHQNVMEPFLAHSTSSNQVLLNSIQQLLCNPANQQTQQPTGQWKQPPWRR